MLKNIKKNKIKLWIKQHTCYHYFVYSYSNFIMHNEHTNVDFLQAAVHHKLCIKCMKIFSKINNFNLISTVSAEVLLKDII